MKPSDYSAYAHTIDLLSNPAISEDIQDFIHIVTATLPEHSTLLDVGGGTGYVLNKILARKPSIKATLIEPSADMFNLATQNRQYNTHYINDSFQNAITTLPVTDSMMFCRALYSFSGKLQDYDPIFASIASKLRPYGHLFILEPNSLYDVAAFKQQIKQRFEKIPEDFNQHWPAIKYAIQRFNNAVIEKEFTLFDSNTLTSLAQRHGFNSKFINNTIYVFRKNH